MTDDCREAFENKFKTMDLTKTRDAFDKVIYAHSHVQAMFEGYEAAWNTRTPPAGDAQGALEAFEKIRAYAGEIQRELWKAENNTQKISEMLLCLCNSYRDYNKEVTDAHDTVLSALSAPKDISALIAEVMEELKKGNCDESDFGHGYYTALQTFAEKLTAAMKDKGV